MEVRAKSVRNHDRVKIDWNNSKEKKFLRCRSLSKFLHNKNVKSSSWNNVALSPFIQQINQ